MVQTSTLGGVTSDWLASEATDGNHRFSRDNITVAANQTFVTGQVVKADGSGNAVPLAAVTDTPIGIICEPVSTGATVGVGVVVSRHARVVLSALTFGIAATDPQKLTILGNLNTVITVRSV